MYMSQILLRKHQQGEEFEEEEEESYLLESYLNEISTRIELNFWTNVKSRAERVQLIV